MKRLSDKKWNEIREEVLQGKSIAGISRKFKVSRKAIYDNGFRNGYLKKRGFLIKLINKIIR